MEKQLLIGGQALVKLGSSRQTKDTDYFVCRTGQPTFIFDKENNIDYINAGADNKFFAEIWKKEADNKGEIASPQSLMELKAYSLVMHCRNFHFQKADDAEYDMKFLVRAHGAKLPTVVKKYVSTGEYSEIEKIINSLRK